jgi:hypothetical protein
VTEQLDPDYYAILEARLKRLVQALEHSFTSEEIALLVELAEHNEPGVAVEMLGELLVERDVSVNRQQFDEFRSVAETMGLESTVWEQLRPAVRGV